MLICNPSSFILQVNVHVWDMCAAGLSHHTYTHEGTECFPHLKAMHYSCWPLTDSTQNLTGLPFPRLGFLGMLSEPAGKQVWEGYTAFLHGPEHTVQSYLGKTNKYIHTPQPSYLIGNENQIFKLPPAHSNSAISQHCRLCSLQEHLKNPHKTSERVVLVLLITNTGIQC